MSRARAFASGQFRARFLLLSRRRMGRSIGGKSRIIRFWIDRETDIFGRFVSFYRIVYIYIEGKKVEQNCSLLFTIVQVSDGYRWFYFMVRFIFRAMIQVNSFDLEVELSLVNLRIIILLGEISWRMDHLRWNWTMYEFVHRFGASTMAVFDREPEETLPLVWL